MTAFVVFVALLLLFVAVGTCAGKFRPDALEVPPFTPYVAPIATIPAVPSRPAAPLMRPAPRKQVNLTDKLRSIDWFQFEKLMEIVYRKKGYRVDRRGGANPDGGIDLILMKGAEKVAVQCKHWRKWNVAVPKIRELVGAMTDAKISKGILVTISDYTDNAKEFGDRNAVEIVNHSALVTMLDSVDAAYDPEIQALLNDTRKICPKCEREMVLRTAKKGSNVGGQFWGCSGFPSCWHIESVTKIERDATAIHLRRG